MRVRSNSRINWPFSISGPTLHNLTLRKTTVVNLMRGRIVNENYRYVNSRKLFIPRPIKYWLTAFNYVTWNQKCVRPIRSSNSNMFKNETLPYNSMHMLRTLYFNNKIWFFEQNLLKFWCLCRVIFLHDEINRKFKNY